MTDEGSKKPLGSMRIARALASTGIASRRKAEDLVRKGLITINGVVIRNPAIRVDPTRDRIEVAGIPLRKRRDLVYILLYKPRGVLCTTYDPKGRRTVLDLLPWDSQNFPFRDVRLYPVGRLDYNSEGVILLTNDGDLAHKIMHPRYGCHKTYWVKVKGKPKPESIQILRHGVWLDRRKRSPIKVSILRSTRRNTWMEIVLREGIKHQVKRMFLAVHHPVLKLIRVAIGPLEVDGLLPGQFRILKDTEIENLKRELLFREPLQVKDS